MRDDDDDDLVADDNDASGDDEEVLEPVNEATKTKNKYEARRKLERMRERKELLKQLGDDWTGDMLGDEF